MNDIQLKIDHLRKTYDQKSWILKDISLDLKENEFLVLVGPSGCGKSTLLRSIAGLEDVTSGSIQIAGREVTKLSPSERNIAMVFQDYALYPHMTVRDNLGFGLKMRKIDKETIDRETSRAAKILDIEHLLDRKPAQLSGGQRQRVAIGRAIVRRADLFLFDEPLSNLDAKLRSQTRIELADLHRKIGATSVYVTHDQVEAMTLADRIVVLNRGSIQQIGSPMELYHSPANKFVASFIGSPNMNFFSGELSHEKGRSFFRFEDVCLDLTGTALPAASGSYTLGIRPEDIKVLASEGREALGPYDCEIKVILKEPHGHEAHMVATLGGQQLILRSANPLRLQRMMQASVGSCLPVTMNRENLHWFADDEQGQRIETSPASDKQSLQ